MYDLALSKYFDLVVSASRDLAGVSGNGIAGQRIKTRLRIERGSWVLNPDIGSILTSSLSRLTNENLEHIPAIVTEALSPLHEDIEVVNVEVTKLSETEALVSIYYRNVADIETLAVNDNVDVTIVPVGIAGGE